MKARMLAFKSFYAPALSILALRWAAGIIFLSHGLPKLQHGPEWVQAFGQMGFPGFFAYISGAMETVGGALLIIGLGSRFAAAFLTLEMAIAFLRVDLPSGRLLEVHNYELSMILAAVSLTIAAHGPGRLSADSWLSRGLHAERNVNAAAPTAD